MLTILTFFGKNLRQLAGTVYGQVEDTKSILEVTINQKIREYGADNHFTINFSRQIKQRHT